MLTYIGGIARERKGSAININRVADHIHLLVRLPASLPVAKTVEIVKTNSLRWIHESRVLNRTFAWQTGYAAFSVSESRRDQVSRYILNQAEHHRKITSGGTHRVSPTRAYSVRRAVSMEMNLPP